MLKKSLKKEQGELKVLKQVDKIVLSSILLCNLVFVPAVLAQNEQDLPINNQINAQMNLVENGISVKDLDIDPINTEKVKKSVVPDAKKEGKKVVGLFLKTMMAVAFCSVILYLILLFVKKFYGSAFVSNDFDEFEALDLSTPTNKTDALKSFLNRTK